MSAIQGPQTTLPMGGGVGVNKIKGPTDIKWSEVPQEEKERILVRAIKDLQKMMERYGRLMNGLTNHLHDDKTGEPIVVKRVGERMYQEEVEKFYSILDDIDFES